MTASTYAVTADGIGPVDVTVDENGEGQPFLLLHGGGGPDTTARFGGRLATSGHLRVLNPVHPGFGGTPAPGPCTRSAASPRSTSPCWTSSAWTTSRWPGTRSAAGSPPRWPS
jgi:pimeloyl-ACP methyl ester carboxylesterase